MLEESISCSPGCETKRSQSRRFHKRFKEKYRRRKDPTSSADVSCMEGLYDESNHILNSTQYEHFNPFENEKILAAADLVRVPKSPSTSKDLSSNGGFIKLEDLPMKENDEVQEEIQEPTDRGPANQVNSETYAHYGPETQFGITESEFVRFCDDAEMDVKEPTTAPTEIPHSKKTIVEMILDDFCSSQSSESPSKLEVVEGVKELTITPSAILQNKKSIVEAILEDFCASPYNESPPKLIAENATPIFRFRTKSIRTYAGSRRRRLRRNIDTELANVHLTDDDGNFSDSSGLSVQEDLTQSVVPQLDTVDLNSSIKVCENLLHLSSYFSQTTSHDKTLQSSVEQRNSRPLPEVVEEIMQLKRRSYEFTRRKSEDEFYGFYDGDSIEEFYGFPDEERKSREDTFKELLEDDAEDVILQQINCDSLCYEKEQPKSSFSYVSELESDLERAKSVIEDANNFLQCLEAMGDVEESNKSPTVCDNLKSLPGNLSQNLTVKEEKLFEDIDLWNDNECLLNYVTQKPNPKQENCVAKNQTGEGDVQEEVASTSKCFGFSTASKKPIAISEEAKRKASELLSKFEQLEMERETADNVANAIAVHNEECTQTAGGKAVFLGFSTASRKPVVISEASRLKADQILRQFEQEEQEQRMTEVMPYVETSTFLKASTSYYKSNVTSNERKFGALSNGNDEQRRSNELSEEVKQKAEELLKDIEFFEDGFEEEDRVEGPACIDAPQQIQPAFEGFKTASRKPIQISDEAKRRADLLIRDIQTEDIPKDFLECIQADLKHDTPAKLAIKEEVKVEMRFEGFKTASKKPIQISEVAKRRAEEIFREVQTDDLPQEFLECIQADLKVNGSLVRASKAPGPSELVLEGFKTASRKSIQISDAAKQRAEQMQKEIETTDLPQDFLKCLQADLKDNSSSVPAAGMKNPIFEGFKTASKKTIQISDAAKQRAEQMLKEIEAADLPPDFIECIQSNLEVEGHTKVNSSWLKDADKKHHPTTTKHEAPSNISPQKVKEPDCRKTIKRKSEVFHSEALLKSPKRRFSCNERTPLNGIENAPLHKTSSHPEMKSSPKKSKKNLLSLSKRQKYNSSKASDISAAAKTPDKTYSSPLRCNANTTPNLKEFFDCVTTSTPRLIRTHSCKVDVNHRDSSIDADFHKINWENANNSARVCKTSSFADLNVTCVEVSPSPKQRIERLKMYGEPPPISPILMVNKCRPSGLRRGRSLMKP